eukprot:PhM_4_TR12335/c0_g1_i1/m.10229
MARPLSIKLQASTFPILYALCALGGLYTCLLLTVRLHLDSVVKTHCGTWEFWPSVSATTGDYMPERAVWRIAMALSSGPRVITSLLITSLFSNLSNGSSSLLIRVSLFFDLFRIACATGWGFVTSSEDLTFHESAFAAYIIAGFVYQSTQLVLCRRFGSERSYWWKRMFFWTQVVAAGGVGYFFYDHRATCLPGRYSRSTMCEWLFSTANVLFDLTQAFDLQPVELSCQPLMSSSHHNDDDKQEDDDDEVRYNKWYYSPMSVLACEVFFSALMFGTMMQFLQITYFVPMVAMKFTSEALILVGPFVCCLLSRRFVQRLLMHPRVHMILCLASLISLSVVDIKQWTEMKILVAGIGFTLLLLALLTRLLRDSHHRYLTLSGLFLGLIVSNIFRMWFYSLDPIFTSSAANAVAILFGIFASISVSGAPGMHQGCTCDLTLPSKEASPTTSPHSPIRDGVNLGALLFVMSWLFTEHGIIARWVGLQPFPSGIFFIIALLAGFALQAVSPTSIPPKATSFLLVASSLVLYYGCRNTILMEGDDSHNVTTYNYYGSPYLSFMGGLVLAFTVMYVGPRIIDSVLRMPRDGIARVLAAQYATFILILMGTIYTVAFPFVPGGPPFRNRMSLLLFPAIAVLASARYGAHKNSNGGNASSSTGSPTPAQQTRRVLLGCSFALGLLVLVVLLRGFADLSLSGTLAQESKAVPSKLRAAIWTIHYGMDNYGTDSFPRIVEQLQTTEATVIGMLETDLSRPVNGNRDIVEYVAWRMNMYSDYGPTTLDNTFGCALFTKHRIHRVERMVAPSPMGELACHIWAHLQIGEDSSNIVQVHVAHFGNTDHWKDRLLHSELLGRLAIRNPGPAIFLGYLTTDPGSDYYRLVVNATTGLLDTGKEVTSLPYKEETLPTGVKAWRMSNTGRLQLKNPALLFPDRYCQYVLYRGMGLFDWYRIDHGVLSDTEIQVGVFDIPSSFTTNSASIAQPSEDASK